MNREPANLQEGLARGVKGLGMVCTSAAVYKLVQPSPHITHIIQNDRDIDEDDGVNISVKMVCQDWRVLINLGEHHSII